VPTLYNTGTGVPGFDSDGTGLNPAVVIATLDRVPSLGLYLQLSPNPGWHQILALMKDSSGRQSTISKKWSWALGSSSGAGGSCGLYTATPRYLLAQIYLS